MLCLTAGPTEGPLDHPSHVFPGVKQIRSFEIKTSLVGGGLGCLELASSKEEPC